MRSDELFENFISKSGADKEITGLASDSRKVKRGDAYFCLPGSAHDGHEFIGDSVSRGAVCIVFSLELSPDEMPGADTGDVLYVRVENTFDALNSAARTFFGAPAEKLYMFGVTGTNGKSTITNLIRDMCGDRMPCGYIGTISIDYGCVHTAPDLTTPDPLFLEKTLDDMVSAGMKACALEVSSQGIANHRVDAIRFDVAVFTNLTYDHLDYHKTMDEYFACKARLFSEFVKPDGVSILNADDARYAQLKEISRARTVSYGIDNECDYRAANIVLRPDGTEFDLIRGGVTYRIVTNLIAKFNVYNLLAAIAALCESGADIGEVIRSAGDLPQVRGRLEQIDEGQGFHVIADFAHTPDGIEKMMQFGREMIGAGHKLIVLTGSAGKRDKAKRRVFGELADKYCDFAVITEDDPRDEDAEEIGREIISGIANVPYKFILDRETAIRYAIELAGTGDMVLLLGKGDEKYIYRENGRAPYKGDDTIAREALRDRLNKTG